jgi:hypothetical protein
MPTDEDDQDDHFLFNPPREGVTLLPPRHAKPLLPLLLQTTEASVLTYLLEQ